MNLTKTISCEDYRTARVAVFDEFFEPSEIEGWTIVAQEVVDGPWHVNGPQHASYDNPLEDKLTFRWLPDSLLAKLTGLQDELSEFCGEPGLRFDASLYGGGVSAMTAGGFLGLHRDLEAMPFPRHVCASACDLRKLNFVLFLRGPADGSGLLEIYSDDFSTPDRPLRRIAPKPGRVVLFDPSLWHGVTPTSGERLSCQAFFYATGQPREGARTAAEFCGRNHQETKRLLNEFRMHARRVE